MGSHMKTYHVKLEASAVYGKDVEIEAESMSEAVEIARNRHCGKEQVEISYSPKCVEPKPDDAGEDYELFEYNHEIFGECDDCKVSLFESFSEKNPDNDYPWQHAAGDTRHHTYICYPCAIKRKEEGNYCPFFKHFYRDEKEGCDTCPAQCDRARDAYYEGLKTVLERARQLSSAPTKAVTHFLEHNEFGLAYETLEECGPRSDSCGRFEQNMQNAKERMEKGWE